MIQRRTPRERLRDIETAIAKIEQFLAARIFGDFVTDAMLHDAVVRNLEVISEASRFLPEETRALEADTPGQNIADMGNWLRHGCDILNDDILWETVRRDLPNMKSAVARMLAVCG
jgi:uncharacterized protein with HEPN domain